MQERQRPRVVKVGVHVGVEDDLRRLEERRGHDAVLEHLREMRLHATREGLGVRPLRGSPDRLGEGALPRPHLPEELLLRRRAVGPVAGLGALHARTVLRIDALHRIEGEHAPPGQVRVGGEARICVRIVRNPLLVVEIGVDVRTHDDVEAGRGGLDAQRLRMPVLHDGVLRRIGGHHLVPPRDAAALLRRGSRHPANEPALESALVAKLLVSDPRLALRTLSPRVGDTFVAADVDDLAGKEVHRLRNQVLAHLDHLVVAKADDFGVAVRVVPEQLADERLLAEAIELGEREVERAGVAGEVDLRHDRHVPFRGELHDVADLRLRVELARRRTDLVVDVPLAVVGTRPRRAGLVELGIELRLDAPALRIGQVPVKDVHLVVRHPLDDALHRLLAEEVPALVHQRAAPGVFRPVLDLQRTLHIPELAQGHTGIEAPGLVRRLDCGLPISSDANPVALARQRAVARLERTYLRHEQRLVRKGCRRERRKHKENNHLAHCGMAPVNLRKPARAKCEYSA